MEDGIIVGAKNLLPDSICHSDRSGEISHSPLPIKQCRTYTFQHFIHPIIQNKKEKPQPFPSPETIGDNYFYSS